MELRDELEQYSVAPGCRAKELSEASGLSAAAAPAHDSERSCLRVGSGNKK